MVETIDLGWNRLVAPHNTDNIYQQVFNSLGKNGKDTEYPYGKGDASTLIAKHLN